MCRRILNFNNDFKFHKGDIVGAQEVNFNDTNWENITLPHDWSIYGDFKREYTSCSGGGFRPTGIGWYRKKFFVPEEYEDKIVEISFGGIYRKPKFFVNGKKVAEWVNGYITKTINIADYLNYGAENTIAVFVDNSEQPSSRYYTGSGIYRNVQLIVRDKLFIENLKPFITTENVSNEKATVKIETEITNRFSCEKAFEIKYEIENSLGQIVGKTFSKKVLFFCDFLCNENRICPY